MRSRNWRIHLNALKAGQTAALDGGPSKPAWSARSAPAADTAASTAVAVAEPAATAIAEGGAVPASPFLGSRVVKGLHLDDVAEYINETALFRNQWHFRPERDESDIEFKRRMAPTLRRQLADARAKDLLVPQVVYGYFPANADGDQLVIWQDVERTAERVRFRFPRQQHEPGLCIADFFRPLDSPEVDYAAFHIASMGSLVSEAAAELFAEDRYRDYLYLHGLGVEMAEALAEYWHRRIRIEWGFADEDGPTLHGLFRQQYRGGRYSWGYPACRISRTTQQWPSSLEQNGSESASDPKRASNTSRNRPLPR